ncbi:non-specific serine/threonine protein kinase [Neolewinella xylanilytica]|uniref:Non-specific serine/threonine protein kinase n=1 Tax=Neolewinella xylanilytica TaxID=1514080 RepID=A0A2S6I4C2_9BACT|nr:DEAD/DEAH box helicase [Neolewinella xylanilytica]PPK85909.1 non-specific serine/threonine protein kinase [Neolewinella xylanilytica]
MQAAVLFNLFEFRTGVWLAKAYIVGLDAASRPHVIHTAAHPGSAAGYGIEADGPLEEALRLAEQLREKAITEHFRKGAKKMPTLAGLIKPDSKEREAVLRHIHARSARLLEMCRQHGYYLTANLDTRSAPFPHLLAPEESAWIPLLGFRLLEDKLEYRLRLKSPDGEERTIRHLDPRVITNRPAPGWILTGKRLVRLWGLKGDAVRPFLTRDVVEIAPAKIGKYLRDFVAPAARRHELSIEGFAYETLHAPDGLRVEARPHPFSERYLIYAWLRYGTQAFAFGDPEPVAVTHTMSPPFSMTRIVRSFPAEADRLGGLIEAGLSPLEGNEALSVSPRPGPYDNLRWLLERAEAMRAEGIEVVIPGEDGHRYTETTGHLTISAEERGDWLDLRGTVTVGAFEIPFVSLVRYLREGERRYQLPDGSLFLIPEEWFTTYGPGFELARVEGGRVSMARSQAPLLERAAIPLAGAVTVAPAVAEVSPPGSLRARLRPYQLEGVRWLVQHYHERLGACLADDMGLGKTLQTIAVLLYAKERLAETEAPPALQMDLFAVGGADERFLRPLRALIVLPASLVYNWAAEIRRFAPSLTVQINIGTRRLRDERVLGRFDVVLTTYQTALRDKDVLGRIDLEYIVLDESQQIKNRQSKVFRALSELEARHRISLSGTPIENSLSDLWSQMQFINPGLLRGYAFFKKTFIVPIEVHDDALRKQQLRELVGPYLLRRTKAEVAPDLPDLDIQLCYCPMSKEQQRIYEQERSAARNALLGTAPEAERGSYKLLVIQALTRLRQIANHPIIAEPDYDKDSGKLTEVLEQWETIRRSGHKVLIFSSMVRYLELFRAHLEAKGHRYAWLTGSVESQQRAREVERFQTEAEVGTFFISIKAGGTGLNLTAADYVFILDPWWNPTTEEQAIARAHRIGRSGKVIARKFLTRGTLEEKIYQLQQRKRQLAEDIIGSGETLDLDRSEIAFLLGDADQ